MLLPRLSVAGQPLPSARLVSTVVFQASEPPNTRHISTLFMQLGQFIDHDLTHSPAQPRDCCQLDSRGRPWLFPADPYNHQPDHCAPIQATFNYNNVTVW